MLQARDTPTSPHTIAVILAGNKDLVVSIAEGTRSARPRQTLANSYFIAARAAAMTLASLVTVMEGPTNIKAP